MLYIENSKDATRKLLELINEFGKFSCWIQNYATENLLPFYTLTTKRQKEKLRKQSHLRLQKKNKIPRNKPT